MPLEYILSGTIDGEAFKDFHEALRAWEGDKQESDTTVILYLNSEGGTAMDALAFYSRMRVSQENLGTEFHIHVYGLCASAATLILAAGTHRAMAKEAWVMVHEESDDGFSGKVHELEYKAQYMRNHETQWNALMAKHTKVSADEWLRINKQDTYLTPEQCLAMGLIDWIF